MAKKIVLTGGGTAGHVTPNIALIPRLKELDYEIYYIGSYDGIEKKLISDYRIPYYGIATGKFRRYFDPKNFTDPFRVMKGYGEARKYLKQIKPDIVFSKGGFVSVPVVTDISFATVDMLLGSSNPTASMICISFTLMSLNFGVIRYFSSISIMFLNKVTRSSFKTASGFCFSIVLIFPSSKLPCQHRRSPGQARAKSGKHDAVSPLKHSLSICVVQ